MAKTATDPIIDGPIEGGVNTELEYTFLSFDLENHDIKYRVIWGDGTEETTIFYPNATTVPLKHTWNKVGNYKIRAMAIDEYDAESNRSEFNIVIPRNKIFNFKLLEMVFERFPNIFPLIQKLFGY